MKTITVIRKPLSGTVAHNVLKHGTGGLNIEVSRIGSDTLPGQYAGQARLGTFERTDMFTPERVGRFPANVVLVESVAEVLDDLSGLSLSRGGQASLGAFRGGLIYGLGKDIVEKRDPGFGDSGGASRYFKVIP